MVRNCGITIGFVLSQIEKKKILLQNTYAEKTDSLRASTCRQSLWGCFAEVAIIRNPREFGPKILISPGEYWDLQRIFLALSMPSLSPDLAMDVMLLFSYHRFLLVLSCSRCTA